MPLLFLPSVLLVQSVKGGVVVAGVEVEEILQREALHGGGRMELGGGGVVDGEGGEEVALNDGVQALEVDVFGENAFGGEFVHQRVGMAVVAVVSGGGIFGGSIIFDLRPFCLGPALDHY